MSNTRRNDFFALVDQFLLQPLQHLWSFLWRNLSSFWNQSQHTDSGSNQMPSNNGTNVNYLLERHQLLSNNGTDLSSLEQREVVPLSFLNPEVVSMAGIITAYLDRGCSKTIPCQHVSLQPDLYSKFQNLSFTTKIPMLRDSVTTDNARERSTTSIKEFMNFITNP
jgi:hypothetical protein